jgi:hypothetical protein
VGVRGCCYYWSFCRCGIRPAELFGRTRVEIETAGIKID